MIGTKWEGVNKGSEENRDVRCRLAARDFKPNGDEDRSDIFTAMLSLEAKKMPFQGGGVWGYRNGQRGNSRGNG